MNDVARLRVLVVENDDASRRALEKAVVMLGHECRSARDGMEAWEIFCAERPDLILSDWRMPRMDGVELCQRVRRAQGAGYTYFILLTGYDDKEHFVRGMSAGADDYHTKPVDLDELRARLVSAERVIHTYHQLERRNTRLRRSSERAFSIARIDPLTQVANRLRLDEDLRTLWSRMQRYGHRHSAALVDIDRFKDYNDRHGHIAGDELLKTIARTMRDALRRGDALYRYGGEEFLIILPEQSLSAAARAMERMRAAIEELGGATVSIGVAESSPGDSGPDAWIARADAALYRAKERGRNRLALDDTPPASHPAPPDSSEQMP